jgi:hypothetical protein
MRKITSKAQERKKQKRNQTIIAIIMVSLMMVSILGIIVTSFGSQSNSQSEKYNGFTFINNNGFWYLELSETQIPFQYFPTETDSINIEIIENLNLLEDYYNQPLFIYYEDYSSASEVYNSLGRYTTRIQTACQTEEECLNPEDPIKDCSENFILIKESNQTSLTQEENCLYIEGKKEDLVLITDEFLFRVMGIKD